MSRSFEHLTATIARHVGCLKSGVPDMEIALHALVAAAQSATPSTMRPAAHPYESLVARAARGGVSGPAGDIATALMAMPGPLPWIYHYLPLSDGDDLSERIAFAEVIGPDGPLFAPAARVGFTVVAEQTLYPDHSHPAVELYLVIAGHARWTTPKVDRILAPGELVLHRGNEPHAMQTFDEPLLALWGWTGDLNTPARYC